MAKEHGDKDRKDRNETGEEWTYKVMWGWKNDIRIDEVEGATHYEGARGLKIQNEGGATVADYDRDAYRSFIRVRSPEDVPQTRLEGEE